MFTKRFSRQKEFLSPKNRAGVDPPMLLQKLVTENLSCQEANGQKVSHLKKVMKLPLLMVLKIVSIKNVTVNKCMICRLPTTSWATHCGA